MTNPLGSTVPVSAPGRARRGEGMLVGKGGGDLDKWFGFWTLSPALYFVFRFLNSPLSSGNSRAE